MLSRFKFFYILSGFFLLSAINPIFVSNTNAEESLKIDLNSELKKGSFLIGLKQYLGGTNDSFSQNNNITFKADKGFLNLHSFNGIKHKSKKINIIWKDIPIKTPDTIERLVFGPFASYESAQKQAKNLTTKGFEASVAYPKNWEVWIPFENNLPKDQSTYKLSKIINKSQITPFLKSEYTFQKLEGPIYISSKEDITINNINFGKRFYLAKDSYGTWTLIQQIKFDDYLQGVLPYEIGPKSPFEALKAQAVIARTWAIYNAGRFSMDKYHLCITTQCQVYKPTKIENKKVKKAIKETSNLIITYKNQPINSFYHGSNGGLSATASESWRIEDFYYLKTKIDGSKLLKKSFNIPFQKDSDLNKFLDFEKKDFYGNNHSLFRWNKKVSSLKIADYLIKKKLINKNGIILDLNVIERGSSGRVTKLEIKVQNSDNNIVLVKDEIRRIFNFLPSNLFTIDKLNDNLWIFRGGGFGHGVGLSQGGAIEMAELGFNYQKILNHYYPGTKIKKIEILSR